MFRLIERITVQDVQQALQQHAITLHITKKRVKNINFRIKPHQLNVSAPIGISETRLVQAIWQRLEWAIKTHHQLIARQQTAQKAPSLWGETFDVDVWVQRQVWMAKTQAKFSQLSSQDKLLWIYQQELREHITQTQAKWQHIVGKSANEIRFRNMRSRWGSCNVKTANITLNIQLAAYPKMCSEYVLVHELCHLHHANHSAQFWRTVQDAMPAYQQWHQQLKCGIGACYS